MAEKFDVERIKIDNPLSEYILRRGIHLKKNGREFEACCPFHAEKTPSFQVFTSREGYEKFHCKGCDVFGNVIDFVQRYDGVTFPEACEILGGTREAPTRERIQAPPRETFDPYKGYTVLAPPAAAPTFTPGQKTVPLRNPKREAEGGPAQFVTYTPTLVHPYRQPDVSLIGYVLRVDIDAGRKITPLLLWCRHADGSEGWTHHPMPAPRPLYGLDRDAAHPGKQWLVTEGEKCADVAAATLPMLVSISWQGGGKSYAKTDWSRAKGQKIVAWMDNDDEGERTMLGYWKADAWFPGIVELLIVEGAASVKVIGRDPDKPKGWDLADAVNDDGWSAEQVLAYAKERAQVWTMDEVRARKAETRPAPPIERKPAPKPQTATPQLKTIEGGQTKPRPSQPRQQPERIVTPGEIPTITRWLPLSAIDDEAEAGWKERLLKKKDAEGNDKGVDPKSLNNWIILCRYHPEMVGVLAWNDFSAEVVLRKCPPWERCGAVWHPRAMEDNDARLCAAWLETEKMQPKPNQAGEAMQTVAMASKFNPVRDWLDGLNWDGVKRLQGEANIEPWLTEYMGAKNTRVNAAFGTRWLIAAVARVYEPGAKVDTMLILEGPQGARKSTALKIMGTLGGQSYFTDGISDIGSKDASIVMNGIWIGEIAELDAMRGRESSLIKSWLSRSTDRFRPPYGKIPVNLPRRAVLAGTVNPNGAGYLKDSTGGRRFWPVRVHGKIDLDRLAKDQPQLWAEAVALYKAGVQWWLTDDEETVAAKVQKARQEPEPWADSIEDYASTKDAVTVGDIMKLGLGLTSAQQTHQAQTRITDYLKANGWTRGEARIAGQVRKCWVRGTDED